VKLNEVKNNAPVDAARFEAAVTVAAGEHYGMLPAKGYGIKKDWISAFAE
jgi:hypothetical protein